ncbi:hypothetical protein PV376_28595 [Streptomyces sp. NRRL_ISP-5395]|uniref:hypothetical protein n=1 Tax=Streptomyces TaxID=1883 RepID=UPI001875416F|nr:MULTISPECIES: hypothetical protein [Streptomyces]MDX2673466.1 hypothetical protein [Streptomyces sp. NRRL_ISP-5395]GHF62391.1 hypothetical protein GCM10010504_33190 [Streptomyces griseus]
MTTTTAARAAVDPRPARGTAGRRAVQVGLLVVFLGGLLALGILAGGRAEAQERPDPGPLTSSVADAVPDVVPDVVPEDAAPEAAAREAAEPSARPVAERAADPVATAVERAAERTAHQQTAAPQVQQAQQGQQAVRESAAPARVRDAVVVATEDAGDTDDAVERVAGEVRPLVPDLPGLLPLLSVLPVPGGSDAPGAPSPSVPGTGRGAEDGAAKPGDAAAGTSDESAGREAGRGARAPFSAPETPAVPGGSGTPGAGHVQSPAPTPAQDRAPFGPCGDLARTATADVQGPRGGDLHAVPAPGGPHAALVRGAGLPATAAPIPDRSGEILAFPG